jgi:hypothetical protein
MFEVRYAESRMRIGITTDSAVDLFQMLLGWFILMFERIWAALYAWHLPVVAAQPKDGWPVPFDVSGFIL